VLKSSKPMPLGKQITCVKCHKPFAVSADVQLSVTGESHAGTSLLLAETHAGLARSPMADTPASPMPPVTFEKKDDPTPAQSTPAKTTPEWPASAHLPVRKKPEPSPTATAAKSKNAAFKLDDGKEVITLRRPRRNWTGLVAAVLLLLLLAGGGALAVMVFPERLGLQQHLGQPTPPAVSLAQPMAVAKPVGQPAPKVVLFVPDSLHKPVSKSQQQKIDEAIDKGVSFLRDQGAPTGSWVVDSDKEHPVGYAALPALALLECKTPVTDPAIVKAADFVRNHCDDLADTYDLGLAVLFLDRLGDPRDRPLLQNLALRLIAGQTAAGGWDYKCPVLPLSDARKLLTFLQGTRPKIEFFIPIERTDNVAKSEPAAVIKPTITQKQADDSDLPPALRGLPIVAYLSKKSWNIDCDRPGDNSNTQFGLLGLWAARRHGVPTELSLDMVGARFEATQNPSGGWGYAMRGPSKNTMTCVGLLGLAMSHGAAAEAYLDAASKGKAPPRPPLTDPRIKDGLAALGQFVDGDDSRRGLASRLDYYYLWTLERVGMLYQREKFGEQDWYQWGVKILLDRQIDNGSWQQHYNPVADTSFALLFLRRSDLVRELTNNLRFYVAIPKE